MKEEKKRYREKRVDNIGWLRHNKKKSCFANRFNGNRNKKGSAGMHKCGQPANCRVSLNRSSAEILTIVEGKSRLDVRDTPPCLTW
jgi:hypothetical protein